MRRILPRVLFALCLMLGWPVRGQNSPGTNLILTNIDNGDGKMTIVAYGFTGGAITLLSATNLVQLTNSPVELSTKLASRDIETYWSVTQTGSNTTFYSAVAASVTNFNIKIISLPEDDIVPTNGFSVFSVVAENAITPTNALFYQWFKNDIALAGQTSASLIITNATIDDVGFYTCDLRTTTNGRPLRVLGKDGNAPGARLYVYSGTATAIAGPYQPAGYSPGCVGSYTGYCIFKDEVTGRYSFARPPGSTSVTLTDKTILSGYRSKIYYYESYTTMRDCNDGQDLITLLPAPWNVPTPSTATRYQFSIYGKTTPFPPTIGIPLTLDVHFN